MKKNLSWQVVLGVSAVGMCMICCLGAGLVVRFAPDMYQTLLDAASLDVGDEAPDFELKALDGTTVRLSDFEGSPVLLTFGATWCPGCRLEAPLVENIHKANPELVVLLVNLKEDADTVEKFADTYNITHPILLDRRGLVASRYQVFVIPTAIFIDADGVIRAKAAEQLDADSLVEKLTLIGIQL